jgi:hypothetical protein
MDEQGGGQEECAMHMPSPAKRYKFLREKSFKPSTTPIPHIYNRHYSAISP